MGNIRYERGYRFENELVHHLLDELKWPYATRTAGSHTVADVIGICIETGQTYFFQNKTDVEEIDLTKLLSDVKVFKLRNLPDTIAKIVAIRVGLGRNRIIKFYKWIKVYNSWAEIKTFNLKTTRRKEIK